MSCDQWQAQLDAYLDGELLADQMRSLDTHLRTCPACSSDALARVQFKRAVKAAGLRFAPSPKFRSQVQKQIAAKPHRGWSFSWVLATAAIGVLLVAGLVPSYLQRQNLVQQHLYSELADLHVSTLASSNPVDVVSTDRHTVKPWFQGKIPFTFNLPDLQNSDFSLLGGRLTYLGQVPGAHLIYQIRKHNISVFIFPEEMVQLGDGVKKERSFSVETWARNGLRYVVVGDASPDDIQKLTALLKSAGQA
jgi:anti-sigma factor RsiW